MVNKFNMSSCCSMHGYKEKNDKGGDVNISIYITPLETACAHISKQYWLLMYSSGIIIIYCCLPSII